MKNLSFTGNRLFCSALFYASAGFWMLLFIFWHELSFKYTAASPQAMSVLSAAGLFLVKINFGIKLFFLVIVLFYHFLIHMSSRVLMRERILLHLFGLMIAGICFASGYNSMVKPVLNYRADLKSYLTQ